MDTSFWIIVLMATVTAAPFLFLFEIRKNYKAKRCISSLPMIAASSLLAYSAQRINQCTGLQFWYIWIGTVLSLTLAMVITAQFFYYRRRKRQA